MLLAGESDSTRNVKTTIRPPLCGFIVLSNRKPACPDFGRNRKLPEALPPKIPALNYFVLYISGIATSENYSLSGEIASC